MNQIATITSKRQFTIPVLIYDKIGLKQGQKVIVSLENNIIKIEPAINYVNQLAGSLTIPKQYKNIPLEDIIEKSKLNHFSKQNGLR